MKYEYIILHGIPSNYVKSLSTFSVSPDSLYDLNITSRILPKSRNDFPSRKISKEQVRRASTTCVRGEKALRIFWGFGWVGWVGWRVWGSQKKTCFLEGLAWNLEPLVFFGLCLNFVDLQEM